jgi:myo-inositol-1(or 4)-monophosphatase
MINRLSFATELAINVGVLLLQYFKEGNLDTHQKKDHSLVTQADIQADQMIQNAIQASFPHEAILSEELNPSLQSEEHRKVWIIDPLDGTTNFTLGVPYWGVLIALVENDIPLLCVNHFPALNELYSSEKEQGAFLNHNRIFTESPGDPRKLSFFSCCSRTFRHYRISVPYKIRIFGSAAYSMCSVARGISKIAFEARAKIWDLAGAWLLVTEAGGAIDSLNSDNLFPLKYGVDYSQLNYPIVAAASETILQKSKSQIIPNSGISK